jgi:surface antigen
MKRILAILLAALLAGCQGMTREDTGTVIGGVLGGVIGAQVNSDSNDARNTAIILGTLAGAFIGRSIGRYMDESDRARTAQTLEQNPTYQPASWTNPDTGRQWEVTPTRTYQDTSGTPCREYKTAVLIDGKEETAIGTACRRADGDWQIQ